MFFVFLNTVDGTPNTSCLFVEVSLIDDIVMVDSSLSTSEVGRILCGQGSARMQREDPL